jgi:hypothetical protein
MDRNALIIATSIGSIAQVAMIVAGHYIPFVKDRLFGIVGVLISLAAGLLYARLAHGGWPDSLIGGAIAGGVCALIGIAPSVALGDTMAMILVFGTLGSAVGGVIGGALGKLIS